MVWLRSSTSILSMRLYHGNFYIPRAIKMKCIHHKLNISTTLTYYIYSYTFLNKNQLTSRHQHAGHP